LQNAAWPVTTFQASAWRGWPWIESCTGRELAGSSFLRQVDAA
jgi:hypothetical protein